MEEEVLGLLPVSPIVSSLKKSGFRPPPCLPSCKAVDVEAVEVVFFPFLYEGDSASLTMVTFEPLLVVKCVPFAIGLVKAFFVGFLVLLNGVKVLFNTMVFVLLFNGVPNVLVEATSKVLL